MASDHTIEHEGERIPYSIVRSNRRTIAIIVGRDGAVRVRAPHHASVAEIVRIVGARSAWIARKRAEMASLRPITEPEPLTRMRRAEIHRLLDERLGACWETFRRPGEDMPTLRVRAMRTRWGSLSPAGAMSLNAHLAGATGECIDYVVFHELCHLRVRGHGSDFYRELARYVPDWKERRKELRHALP